MRTIRLLLCCLCLSVILSPLRGQTPPAPERTGQQEGYDVYLLIGQSNMAGRGYMLASDTTDTMPGVWLLNGQDIPEPARNPLNRYSTVRKRLNMQRISPGTTFGVTVAEKTGRKVLLVVNALGGSSITAWAPDAPMAIDKESAGYGRLQLYAEAVRRTREALKYGTLRGILWHQGEADSRRLPEYPAMLETLVENLRRDLNAPQVPFVAGELAYWRGSSKAFNEMIRGIDGFVPYSGWVSAEGLGQLIDERDPHFSRDGQLLLGERYAQKILEMVYGME